VGLRYLAAIVWNCPLHAGEDAWSKYHWGMKSYIPTNERLLIFMRDLEPYVFGHSFIVYGTIECSRKDYEAKIAGLHTNDAKYLDGVFSRLSASVGRAKDDLTDVPEVIYRRQLTTSEYYGIESWS